MASRIARYSLVAVASALATPVALAEPTPRKRNLYDEEVDGHDASTVAPVPGTSEVAHDPEQNKTNDNSSTLATSTVGGMRVRSSEALEKNVGVARKWLAEKTEQGQQEIDNAFQKYLHAEKSVTDTIAELKSDKEDFLPGGIYVLVSALSGSILARNRGLALRTVTPLVFGAGAFAYFLPNTFQNTRGLAWRYEQRAPALAEYHVKTQEQLEGLAKSVDSAVDDGMKALEDGVHKTRQFIADSTGLQLPDEKKKK
uniref:MICOS complex subunit n=1 Tax=Blastobotrys adeninivorans TaxID=409370 RepID=A0A060TI17_BLAAD